VFPPSASESLAKERAREARRETHPNAERILTDALADTPLFSQCSKRELKLVAKLAKTKSVPAGTVIVAADEPGDAMFVLLSGSASVVRGSKKLAQLGAGDVIGELALLSHERRNATVTTTTAADIARIDRKGVNRLLEDSPGFARKLLEALANRVRDLDKKLAP
jgi:CRP-like cAMP-binding protein